MRQPVSISGHLLLIALVALLFGSFLTACSGDGDDDGTPFGDGEAGLSEVHAEPSADGGVSAENEAPAGADRPDAQDGLAAPYAWSSIENRVPDDQMVIRTARLTLTVESVPAATNWMRDLAARKGGFVFSSNSYIHNENDFAEITIRVPADQYDSTILELRDHDLVIRVDREESSAQDVSQEFVDNEARLKALEETQRRYLALLAEAKDVDSILRIESELTELRSQIETIKGRQRYIEQMTAYSTITIALHGEDGKLPGEKDGDSFLDNVFNDSWGHAQGFIEGLAIAIVTIGIVAVAVLPLVAIGYLGFRLVRHRIVRA